MLAIHKLFGSGNFRCEIILPFGCAYLSFTMQQFWSKWSRPVGQWLRLAFYYPFGGHPLAILLVFAFNSCRLGILEGVLLPGDWGFEIWIIGFGTLGVGAMMESVATSYITNICKDRQAEDEREKEIVLPKWFIMMRGLFAWVVTRFACVYIFDNLFPGIFKI